MRSSAVITLLAGLVAGVQAQDDLDRPPISYSSTAPQNLVSETAAELTRNPNLFTYEKEQGYLKSVLAKWNVPIESQVLVFSKTSLQRERISPRRPRAIYFNDDVYVGYCQNGQVLEVSVADIQLGTAFYTVAQDPKSPKIMQHTENCLVCHGSSHTRGYPGHLVRSAYADSSGNPVLSLGSHRIDHSSPLADRWGGWYVTGTSGSQVHLGNLIVDPDASFASIDRTKGTNCVDLSRKFRVSAYLSPHSDLVSLMVLEHQVEAHNHLTRASFLARQCLYEEAELRRMLGDDGAGRSEGIQRRLDHAAEPLVEYFLFAEEVPLKESIAGTSKFVDVFAQRGPKDQDGRSLRQLDLNRRLFKYPCSYLIYSPSFDALPKDVGDIVWRRLWEVLSGKDQSERFKHLTAEDRQAVREIILATKPNVPAYWKSSKDVASASR